MYSQQDHTLFYMMSLSTASIHVAYCQFSYAVVGNINKNLKMESKGRKNENKNDIWLTGSKIDSDRKLQSYAIPLFLYPRPQFRFINTFYNNMR